MGALFFGVPSGGMHTQHLVAMAAGESSKYTVNLLNREVGGFVRQQQHEEFCAAFPFRDSKVIQYFEGRKTKLPDEVCNTDSSRGSMVSEKLVN